MASHLRILCVNDVYKPERFSMLKTLTGLHQGPGETKLGDFLGGSTFAAAHKGLSVLEVLNCLNIDYFTLGNHEFDFGAANVGELMEKSNFKWLGSNVRHADSKALFNRVMDTDIFDVNINNKKKKSGVDGAECDQSAVKSGEGDADDSIRVGVFGVCTQFTPMLSDPGDEVVFEDVFEHSERCVAALRQQHCNFIIALTHLELENDKRIAEALDIDVIIGGHEHTPFYFTHSGTTIIKCGQNMDDLGILDLTFQKNSDNNVKAEYSFKLLPTEDTERDETVDSVIRKWTDTISEGAGGEDILCAIGDHCLSTLTSDLRTRETAFACMVADAIVYSYEDLGCQLGIQNGGFVRQDMIYKPSAVLSRSTILSEMPFPRIPTLLKMNLRDIVTGLEQMIAGAPAAIGSFPHISADWEIKYDLSEPPLHRIQSVSHLGKPLDLLNDAVQSTVFLVVISDFYVEKGGDGVDIFTTQEVVSSHTTLISECVVEFLEKRVDVLCGEAPGRFVCVTRN